MSALVERDNIGIFGRMNAGKSSIMNLITQQATSIVDAFPGTTADTKISLFEIHGLGPARLFDTAGIDESSALGEKKKQKAMNDLKECNLVLIVIDPSRSSFEHEANLVQNAREMDKQIIIIYNLFNKSDEILIPDVEAQIPLLKFHKKIVIHANDNSYRQQLIEFILKNYEPENPRTELLPFIKKDEYYILVIPMDDETPPGRYLRPQLMTEEFITRNWAFSVAYRPDLTLARGDADANLKERQRFDNLINGLAKRPKCIITDSQAMDIMSKWCPEDIDLTTYSIVMIQYMSGGRLNRFADGIKALDNLKAGDSILISEACNHSRIGEDIGTVQIPNIIKKKFPGVNIDHTFGREFQEKNDLGKYSLIISCGGCMISRQKMSARVRDLESVGVPYTNYGVFLSAIQGNASLKKVLRPWNI